MNRYLMYRNIMYNTIKLNIRDVLIDIIVWYNHK